MFKDRIDAGRKLAKALLYLKSKTTVVLALPRGGVVLGAEVARELRAPLGLILVRKIGHPASSEYAIGAIAEGEDPIYNESEFVTINKGWLETAEILARELIEDRRELYFEAGINQPQLAGKTVIIVDDGMATGLTMKAAVLAIKDKHPAQIIVAVPVAPQDSVDMIGSITDEVIVLDDTKNFMGAIGAHYERFGQVDDIQVRTILAKFKNKRG